MANIKQQIKRIQTNNKANVRNTAVKSEMKTAIKAVRAAVVSQDKDAAVKAYTLACKKLDKAMAKGIVHKNFVARNKSNLALLINSLN